MLTKCVFQLVFSYVFSLRLNGFMSHGVELQEPDASLQIRWTQGREIYLLTILYLYCCIL